MRRKRRRAVRTDLPNSKSGHNDKGSGQRVEMQGSRRTNRRSLYHPSPRSVLLVSNLPELSRTRYGTKVCIPSCENYVLSN
jgi:hypothetical protein